jgi:hypothetical protein
VLCGLYDDDSERISGAMDLMHDLWEWLRSASSESLLSFLCATQEGLTIWLRDENKILSEELYADLVRYTDFALFDILTVQ